MKELQQRILNDKDNYYTYSKDYLSLSISPVNLREKLQEEKLLSDKVSLLIANLLIA